MADPQNVSTAETFRMKDRGGGGTRSCRHLNDQQGAGLKGPSSSLVHDHGELVQKVKGHGPV